MTTVQSRSTQVTLWASVAVFAVAVLMAVAMVSGRARFQEAVAMELAPASAASLQQALSASLPLVDDDPFRQQKLNAKSDELPAQF